MKTSTLGLSIAAATGLSSLASFGTPSPGPVGEAEQADFMTVMYETSPRLEESEIKVSIRDHIATLSGTATTLDQIDFATSCALATDGVFGVINRVEIRPDSGSAADPAKAVGRSIAESRLLDGSRITVTGEKGAVILAGSVSTFDERELARELASRVTGVREIDNRLEIEFTSPRTEEGILEQLRIQFHDDPLFDMLPVDIGLSNGTVTLSGTVGSQGEKVRLERTSLVTGVMQVDASELRVDPDLAMEGMGDKDYHVSDSMKVAKLVLEADPRVDANAIDMEMIDGHLVLSGKVPSQQDRKIAEADARGVPGVLGVMNRLEVATSLSSR